MKSASALTNKFYFETIIFSKVYLSQSNREFNAISTFRKPGLGLRTARKKNPLLNS